MNDLLGIGHNLNPKATYNLKNSRPLACQIPVALRFENSDCFLTKDNRAVKLGSRLGHAGFLVLSLSSCLY